MNPELRGAMNEAAHGDETRPRSAATLIVLAVGAAWFFVVFMALGTWPVQRLYWKLDLIARVNQRVHAAPVAAPDAERWPQVTAETDEYRHVRVSGSFLYELTTQVQAVTALGSGYWLLTPLQRTDGGVILINRGFIPPNAEDATRQSATGNSDPVTVTGLLRMSEPGGAFLRTNDAAHDRWYSRDVQAIAASHGLSKVAPYFVDADASTAGTANAGQGYPVGGLTVISFHNSHLVYAITWYALALMVAGASWWVVRDEQRQWCDHAQTKSRE